MGNYRYFNYNPSGERLEDCVCRAIGNATGLKYLAVENLLVLTAEENSCEMLCVCCYKHLLTDTLCYPCIECDFNVTVSKLASNYPNNILIIRLDQHLTCSIDGIVEDIWDCGDELVDCYWIVD